MAIEAISDYLGETVPRVIKTDPPGTGAGPRCWKKSEGFRASYQTLGESLLEERNTLVGAVIRSNAAGYNVGVKDFIHQVMPFF